MRGSVSDRALLQRIDMYLDAVPRTVARTEEVGPFTLFVNEGRGWRYYARPRPGETAFTASDVAEVRSRQRELAQPEELAWVDDLTPEVEAAAEGDGLVVAIRPLLHLSRGDFTPATGPTEATIRLATPDDDLAALSGVAKLAFGSPGTDVGPGGADAVAEASTAVEGDTVGLTRERIAAGLSVVAFATIDETPVAVGTHQPVEGVTEIVGVGSAPAFRRRGLGAAVTSALVADAFERGVETVFLSAGDETIARVYERVGFRTIGHVGAAVPDLAP
jgi:ribosomal protein S18 acetylase RimI-like enzyme